MLSFVNLEAHVTEKSRHVEIGYFRRSRSAFAIACSWSWLLACHRVDRGKETVGKGKWMESGVEGAGRKKSVGQGVVQHVKVVAEST